MFGGKIEFSWYLPSLIFFKFIVFGGIEEIDGDMFFNQSQEKAAIFLPNNPNPFFLLGDWWPVVLLH